MKRIEYIDVLRILACFLVLMTHSVLENVQENSIYLGAMSYIASPSSELFLALSGAVLLPVRKSMKVFYQQRFLKLLPPLLFWSLVGCLLHYFYDGMSKQDFLIQLACIPLKPVIGVYWFLYVMIGLYLFAPLISPFLLNASRKQIEFFLVFWLITLFIPWLNLFIPDFYDQDGSYYWPFCYFGGFLGYWVLGFYNKKWPIDFRSKYGFAVLFTSVAYFFSILYLKYIGVDIFNYTNNLQWGSAAWVCLIFMSVRYISQIKYSKRLVKICTYLAPYSFGIYLLHIYILDYVVKPIMKNYRLMSHPVMETLIIIIMTTLISFIIIKIISANKTLGRYLFGLK